MIKAVIFDLGHTLTKEIDVHEEIESLLKPYNLNWENFYSYWKKFYYLRSIGELSSDKEMFSFLKKVLERKNLPLQKIRDIIIFKSHIIPRENIKVIKKIKKEYKVGLITNFVYDWIKNVFEIEKIDKLFDVLVVSSNIRVRKPSAELFYIALKALSIKPDEAVFVSDDLFSDLICAKGCGLKTIWINKGFKNKKGKKEIVKIFQPDAIIKNLRGIISILKRWRKEKFQDSLIGFPHSKYD